MSGKARPTRSATRQAAAGTANTKSSNAVAEGKDSISLVGMSGDQKKALTSRLRNVASKQRKEAAAKQRADEAEAPDG